MSMPKLRILPIRWDVNIRFDHNPFYEMRTSRPSPELSEYDFTDKEQYIKALEEVSGLIANHIKTLKDEAGIE